MPKGALARVCGDVTLLPDPCPRGESRASLLGGTSKVAEAHRSLTSFHQYGKWHPPPPGPPDPVAKWSGYERFPREQVPLCEDLRPGVLYPGEKCYSKCGLPGEEDCRPRVMVKPEDGEYEMVKHPTCKSHVECVGKPERVLCEVKEKGWEERIPMKVGGVGLVLPAAASLQTQFAAGRRGDGRCRQAEGDSNRSLPPSVGHAFL
eukprot:gb/GFBE01000003.1/.p1 GENE.gb/GFBE01000003.1/~~gb/GFBE01000003.1/.p1  ORF type:complete len:205 (+),score=27.83 gb/GFBE01000003.1/:1-615(+)